LFHLPWVKDSRLTVRLKYLDSIICNRNGSIRRGDGGGRRRTSQSWVRCRRANEQSRFFSPLPRKEIVRSLGAPFLSKPPCRPLSIEPCLSFLVGLVAEVPIDPLDHRYRGSRHAGDQENVHARHEHLADPEVAERVERDRGADNRLPPHGGKPLGDLSAIVRVAVAVHEDMGVCPTPLASSFEDGVSLGVERDSSWDRFTLRSGTLVLPEDDCSGCPLEVADLRLNQLMRPASGVVVHGDDVPHEGVSVGE
jgi:hypothetical protein